MKRIFLALGLICMAAASFGQTISLVSPPGLPMPYEVAPGTEVTIQWDYFGSSAVLFSYDQEPELDPFFPNTGWTQNSNSVDNGDGTFNFTFTVNDPVFLWGGFYQEFFGQWAYSNVISIGISSSVVIEYEDGFVCPDGSGVELLSAVATYDSYQWVKDGESIPGAQNQTYAASLPGNYKVEVPVDGVPTLSNSLVVEPFTNQLDGVFDEPNNQLVMTGSDGYTTYQWLSGPDSDNLTEISGATDQTYTAPLTSTTTYYAVAGTIDGCTVTTQANPVSDEIFALPTITLQADTNDFGNVCEGTIITLMTNEGFSNYQWFRNGYDAFVNQSSITISSTWETGEHYVVVTPEGWSNIQLQSETINVQFFTVEAPQLFASESGPYCPGSTVSVVLSDEGYDYTWYVHTEYNYTETDMVTVEDVTLELTFDQPTNVTVVAEYQGCTSSQTLSLNSAAMQTPYIEIPDWQTGPYLCTDSAVTIQISSWGLSDYSNFQWYKLQDETFVEIEGATESVYEAITLGTYMVIAEYTACPGLMLESNSVEIQSYLDRELFVYPNEEQFCVGDETEIFISGSDQWQNIQWFDFDIQIGSSGYEQVEQVIIDAGSNPSYVTGDYNTYFVKARHQSCPTGPKIKSNMVQLRPSINPDITVDPDYGVYQWHLANFDSIPGYLYCSGEGVNLEVSGTYDSYEWYMAQYTGGGDYTLGDQLTDFSGNQADVIAEGVFWVTALVESNGCVGMSDPVLIDTWVFSPPAIASINNAELCHDGDSTLIEVAFAGNYANVEWYINGALIPGENEEFIYATQPGEYTVTVYRAECPMFGMSSGVGPYVTILSDEVEIVEEADLIYAIPQFGQYSYQWYLDGEPIDSPADTPWILYKDEMTSGEYTVEVTNPEPCIILSAPFIWTLTGVDNITESKFAIYPNPAADHIQITGDDFGKIEGITIFDISGKTVMSILPKATIDVSDLESGVYILRLTLTDGSVYNQKWIRK